MIHIQQPLPLARPRASTQSASPPRSEAERSLLTLLERENENASAGSDGDVARTRSASLSAATSVRAAAKVRAAAAASASASASAAASPSAPIPVQARSRAQSPSTPTQPRRALRPAPSLEMEVDLVSLVERSIALQASPPRRISARQAAHPYRPSFSTLPSPVDVFESSSSADSEEPLPLPKRLVRRVTDSSAPTRIPAPVPKRPSPARFKSSPYPAGSSRRDLTMTKSSRPSSPMPISNAPSRSSTPRPRSPFRPQSPSINVVLAPDLEEPLQFDIDRAERRLRDQPGRVCFSQVVPPPLEAGEGNENGIGNGNENGNENENENEAERDTKRAKLARRWSLGLW